MMKKLSGLLLMVLMLLVTGTALADGDVWGLYASTDYEPYLLGSAVASSDGILLSVDGVMSDGMTLFALRMEQEATVTHAITLDNGMLAVFAEGVTGSLPEAAPEIPPVVYVTAAAKGGTLKTAAGVETTVLWRGVSCPLIWCESTLQPGALVTDHNGLLVGMVCAVWGEGRNRYVVLPAEHVLSNAEKAEAEAFPDDARLYDSVLDNPYGLSETTEDPRWLSGFTAEADGTAVTVDWSGAGVTPGEDEFFYVLFMDVANPYFSYVQVDRNMTEAALCLAPERTYIVWVQLCTEDDFSSDVSLDNNCMVQTGDAAAFEDYAYRDDAFYVGFVPAGSEPNAVKAEEADSITVKAILDPETDFTLQAVSAYEVTEEISCTMQVVLETPDGMALLLESGYIFMPDIMHEDVWNCSLEDLFDLCVEFSGFIMAGEYTVSYYFDGLEVNSMTFTVE